MTLSSVLFGRLQITDGCWLWFGPQAGKGYGVLSYKGRLEYVHRISHELFIGPIPPGYDVDHLCRVRLCANPSHLEAVTRAENIARVYADQTGCRNGHPYSSETVYREPKTGRRHCRICAAANARRYRAEKAHPEPEREAVMA